MTVIPGFIPDPVQPDASPEFAATCAFPGCANEVAEYAGRGRRPTKCTDHLNVSSTKQAPSRNLTGKQPSRLAYQAANSLATGNTIVGVLLGIIGMKVSGELLTDKELRAEFVEAAAQALDSDPDFCRTILKGAGGGAKVALLIAYGTVFGNVAPVMMAEAAIKREERKQKREEQNDGGIPSGTNGG
jgi:hypothetical protein